MKKYNRNVKRRILFAVGAWGLIPLAMVLFPLLLMATVIITPILSIGWLLDVLDCGEYDDNEEVDL